MTIKAINEKKVQDEYRANVIEVATKLEKNMQELLNLWYEDEGRFLENMDIYTTYPFDESFDEVVDNFSYFKKALQRLDKKLSEKFIRVNNN